MRARHAAVWCCWTAAFAMTAATASSAAADGPPTRPNPSAGIGDEERGTIRQIVSQIRAWQVERLSQEDEAEAARRPFVLASFAQSLDGRLAPWKVLPRETDGREDWEVRDAPQHRPDCRSHARPKRRRKRRRRTRRRETESNYPLSGPESLLLTHALRSVHDGLLVGGRTLSTDNPRLTNRLWPEEPTEGADADARHQHQPVPIVVDSQLRHVRSLGPSLRASNLVVASGPLGESKTCDLPAAVSEVLECPTTTELHSRAKPAPDGVVDLRHLLAQLRARYGIQTLMVEGGAAILTSLFRQGLVDAVCITIAPAVLCGGVAPTMGYGPVDLRPPGSAEESPKFVLLGSDCIFLGRWPTAADRSPYSR